MDTEAMFLQVLIDRVEMVTGANVCFFNTKSAWLNEIRKYTNRFRLDDGKLKWLGYDVMTKDNESYEELIRIWKELCNTKK